MQALAEGALSGVEPLGGVVGELAEAVAQRDGLGDQAERVGGGGRGRAAEAVPAAAAAKAAPRATTPSFLADCFIWGTS